MPKKKNKNKRKKRKKRKTGRKRGREEDFSPRKKLRMEYTYTYTEREKEEDRDRALRRFGMRDLWRYVYPLSQNFPKKVTEKGIFPVKKRLFLGPMEVNPWTKKRLSGGYRVHLRYGDKGKEKEKLVGVVDVYSRLRVVEKFNFVNSSLVINSFIPVYKLQFWNLEFLDLVLIAPRANIDDGDKKVEENEDSLAINGTIVKLKRMFRATITKSILPIVKTHNKMMILLPFSKEFLDTISDLPKDLSGETIENLNEICFGLLCRKSDKYIDIPEVDHTLCEYSRQKVVRTIPIKNVPIIPKKDPVPSLLKLKKKMNDVLLGKIESLEDDIPMDTPIPLDKTTKQFLDEDEIVGIKKKIDVQSGVSFEKFFGVPETDVVKIRMAESDLEVLKERNSVLEKIKEERLEKERIERERIEAKIREEKRKLEEDAKKKLEKELIQKRNLQILTNLSRFGKFPLPFGGPVPMSPVFPFGMPMMKPGDPNFKPGMSPIPLMKNLMTPGSPTILPLMKPGMSPLTLPMLKPGVSLPLPMFNPMNPKFKPIPGLSLRMPMFKPGDPNFTPGMLPPAFKPGMFPMPMLKPGDLNFKPGVLPPMKPGMLPGLLPPNFKPGMFPMMKPGDPNFKPGMMPMFVPPLGMGKFPPPNMGNNFLNANLKDKKK